MPQFFMEVPPARWELRGIDETEKGLKVIWIVCLCVLLMQVDMDRRLRKSCSQSRVFLVSGDRTQRKPKRLIVGLLGLMIKFNDGF